MRFRVEVRRVGKIQFGKVLWGFRKMENAKLKLPFLKPSCGEVFPAPPAGGLEWKFRVEVQVVASGSY